VLINEPFEQGPMRVGVALAVFFVLGAIIGIAIPAIINRLWPDHIAFRREIANGILDETHESGASSDRNTTRLDLA
jgi:hypothetical protein